MTFKRIFSHHLHRGHHRSRHANSESSEEFPQVFSPEDNDDHSNRHLDDIIEHRNIVQPFMVNNTPGYAVEPQTYRTHRRSSVPILEKKFLQSLSNQTTSSLSTGSDSNATTNISEDMCEF
jgi:hypothetical protein